MESVPPSHVPMRLCTPGDNPLAVQLHQSDSSSSDVHFELSLAPVKDALQIQIDDSAADLLPPSLAEEWLDPMRFAFASKVDAESPTARDLNAWRMRRKIQQALGNIRTASDAIDHELNLLGPADSPEIAEQRTDLYLLQVDALAALGRNEEALERLGTWIKELGSIRINCGGKNYAAPDGTIWSADRFFLGGSKTRATVPVEGTDRIPLYLSERGAFSYRIPLPEATYEVTLHFAQQQVELAERRDPGALICLAQVRFVTVESPNAVVLLEEADRLPPSAFTPGIGHRASGIGHLLRRYRRALPPDLPSFASIDATLNPETRNAAGDPPRFFQKIGSAVQIVSFEQTASGDDALTRLAYLTGRRLQRHKKLEEALAKFEEVVASRPVEPETYASYTTRTKWAEPEIRIQYDDNADVYLNGQAVAALAPWSRRQYYPVALNSPETFQKGDNVLALHCLNTGFEQFIDAGIVESTGNAAWAARELGENGILRINCGGEEYTSADGTVWGRDRFFMSGVAATHRSRESERTDDDPIFFAERFFQGREDSRAKYRIPVSDGRYRVTIHCAELYHQRPGLSVFGLRIEGKQVLSDHDVNREGGFATADARSFETNVEDGWLELKFTRSLQNPKVSAIEVEKLE